MNRNILTSIISYAFILLFLYAAANKLIDYQKFTAQLGQSPILTGYAHFIAWFIPGIEILISILLVFRKTRLLGLYCSLGLMVMFTEYIFAILNFAERIPCSCGGILEKLHWQEHLIFNAAFVVLALIGIFIHDNRGVRSETAVTPT